MSPKSNIIHVAGLKKGWVSQISESLYDYRGRKVLRKLMFLTRFIQVERRFLMLRDRGNSCTFIGALSNYRVTIYFRPRRKSPLGRTASIMLDGEMTSILIVKSTWRFSSVTSGTLLIWGYIVWEAAISAQGIILYYSSPRPEFFNLVVSPVTFVACRESCGTAMFPLTKIWFSRLVDLLLSYPLSPQEKI